MSNTAGGGGGGRGGGGGVERKGGGEGKRERVGEEEKRRKKGDRKKREEGGGKELERKRRQRKEEQRKGKMFWRICDNLMSNRTLLTNISVLFLPLLCPFSFRQTIGSVLRENGEHVAARRGHGGIEGAWDTYLHDGSEN